MEWNGFCRKVFSSPDSYNDVYPHEVGIATFMIFFFKLNIKWTFFFFFFFTEYEMDFQRVCMRIFLLQGKCVD